VNEDVKARFRALGNVRSPPGIAQEIIALAKSEDVSIGEVSGAIAKDPALAAKVLRRANSALYASRRRSRRLRQALTIMGLDAAMTLCLGFLIASSFRSAKAGSIDYTRYWRRSLLAVLGARCMGEELGLPSSEELFLGGLLQDIGVLALERAKPGFYGELPHEASHGERIAYERERLGDDHAALGAWLLASWNLPDELVHAVELSHAPEQADRASPGGQFARCVALGGELASAFLASDVRVSIARFALHAEPVIGLRPEQLGKVVERGPGPAGTVRRSGSLQGRQRYLRPRGRRCCAARRGRRTAADPEARRSAGPLQWPGVRGAAAGHRRGRLRGHSVSECCGHCASAST